MNMPPRALGRGRVLRYWPLKMCACVLAAIAFAACAEQGPGAGPWKFERPEAHGLEGDKLDAAARVIGKVGGRQGLVIVKDGVIVFERYWANDYQEATPTWRNVSFSSGKSWASAWVGVAVTEGLLNVDDPVAKYHPREVSGLMPGTTIRHLLTMSSGGTLMKKPSSKPPQKLGSPPEVPVKGIDYVRLAEGENGTPPGYGKTIAPGSMYYYDGAGDDHLADVVAAASNQPSLRYVTDHLLKPLGVENFNYQPEGIDSNGNVRVGGSIALSVRDMARLGQLWLNHGRWGGRQLVAADYVKQAMTPAATNSEYGFLWWLNTSGRIAAAPCSMVYAAGGFGQYSFILPEEGIVVATMGFTDQPTSGIDTQIWAALAPALGTLGCKLPAP